MPSFGEKLKKKRESRNRTIEEVAGTTEIQLSYLQALEQNDFEALPGPAFGKFYIRAYAEVLDFDPRQLIADYDRELLGQAKQKPRKSPQAGDADRSGERKATPAPPPPVSDARQVDPRMQRSAESPTAPPDSPETGPTETPTDRGVASGRGGPPGSPEAGPTESGKGRPAATTGGPSVVSRTPGTQVPDARPGDVGTLRAEAREVERVRPAAARPSEPSAAPTTTTGADAHKGVVEQSPGGTEGSGAIQAAGSKRTAVVVWFCLLGLLTVTAWAYLTFFQTGGADPSMATASAEVRESPVDASQASDSPAPASDPGAAPAATDVVKNLSASGTVRESRQGAAEDATPSGPARESRQGEADKAKAETTGPARRSPQGAVPGSSGAPPAVVSASTGRLTIPDFGVGKGVVDRELVEPSRRFAEGGVAWFSTRVLGGRPGERIRHVWIREGRTIQSIDLKLGGKHWRTHSRKTLWGTGEWAVEARDREGRVLARETFTCAPAGS